MNNYFLVYNNKNLIEKMVIFNYHLICSSRGCQEGKNFKVPLDKYNDDGNCLLTVKEKKEFLFLCKNCCIINTINFNVIANRETIKLIKGRKLEKSTKFYDNFCEELKVLEQKHKDFLEELRKLKLQ